jgi:alpha-L-fucosidase
MAVPFGRDIIRELETTCKNAGIAFGVYYSHALDWRDGGDSGIKDYGPEKPKKKVFANYFDPAPVKFDDYIANKALPQVRELVNNYELCEIWLDTPIYIPARHSFAFYETIYKANPEILVNQRIGNHFGDFGIPGDNVIPDQINKDAWECVATTNNSWGYKSYDNDWKKPIEILYWLVANVSKGGNLLLNVGPDGMGIMPPQAVANLRTVGEWLQVNGDAIYGTQPWRIDHEGNSALKMGGTEHRRKAKLDFNFGSDNFWFTTKGDKLYAIALARPEGRKILIKSLNDAPIRKIRMLGQRLYLNWEKTDAGVEIELPAFLAEGVGYALEVSLSDN